jgi:hypothetical protein
MMPKDMALAKEFCVTLEDERVGTSQTGINFKKGVGRCCYTMSLAAQVTKDHLDHSQLSAMSQAAKPVIIYPPYTPDFLFNRSERLSPFVSPVCCHQAMQSLKRSPDGMTMLFMMHARVST